MKSIGVDVGDGSDETVWSIFGKDLSLLGVTKLFPAQRRVIEEMLRVRDGVFPAQLLPLTCDPDRLSDIINKPLTSLYLLMKEHPMFETAMFCDLLEQFCKSAHQNAKDKGFWDEQFELIEGVEKDVPVNRRPINLGEKYMLFVSEVAELFEAHRRGTLTSPCDKDCTILDPTSTEPCTYKCEMCAGKGKIPTVEIISSPDCKPEDIVYANHPTTTRDCPSCVGKGSITAVGVRRLTNEEEELADLLIRVADYCGYRKIDLGAAILSKMRFNQSRPHMHGKTC